MRLAPILVLSMLVPATASAQATTPICHSTGSLTNPYVLVDGDPADHESHAADIVPAPAAGCPTTLQTVPSATATPEPVETPLETPTITICQATGDANRPFVEVIVLESERSRYEDGENIVPVPSAGCPKAATAAAATPTPTSPRARPATGVQTASTRSQLPATGAEILLIAFAGLGLCLSGCGLRLLAR